ncbi:hypothetical protein HZ994_01690 [Akkermansiaceae bacterium]|nr:hypothetical protein HZ994_01690 [Akkermansiaceae bacterium]
MAKDEANRRYWFGRAQSLSRRVNLGWFLQILSAPLLIYSVLGACAVLILRRELGGFSIPLAAACIGGGLIVLIAVSLAFAVRRFEKPEETLVRIEAGSGLNNALSSANAGIASWPEPPSASREALKWHLPKTFTPPLAALALLALGLFIPISAKPQATPPPSRQPQAWSQLDAQLEQLKEDEMVDEKYIEEMEKRLEELRAQEEQDWFSHSSLEATDSLKESQNSNMENLEQDLNEAGDALEALAENADKMNAAQKQKLTEEFEQALQGLQNGAMKPNKELLDQLSKLDPNDLGKLNPEQMQQLKENMEKLKESLENAGQGQGEGDDWSDQLLGDAGEGEGEGEGEGNCPGGGDCPGCDDPNCQGNGSGKGGINRGPGHDPNVLKGAKDPLETGELTALEAKDLSRALPGDLLQLQDGKHSVDENASKASAGGVGAQGKGGDRVWKDSLAPDEQRALKKFFE